MTWIGKWRNQDGATLEITDESGHKVAGKFRTTLKEAGFLGHEISVTGVRHGNCIGLSGSDIAPGDRVVTYTGLLRQGRLQTLGYAVASPSKSSIPEDAAVEREKAACWRTMTSSADVFERIA